MFLHADFYHIFFNMFALFMFGRILEEVWGPKRFLSYYLVTGIGAGIIQFVVAFITIHFAKGNLSPDQINLVYSEGLSVLEQSMNYTDKNMATLNIALNGTTIGASGAVFGILLAFGMLFPNTQLMLLFPPIPLKAKYFVILYGVAELFMGVANFSWDNTAHWAHLGGMLFGFFMIRHWRNKGIY
jgi:membrane associated rhomboid family serine protease